MHPSRLEKGLPKLTINQRLKLLKKSAKQRNISINLNEFYYVNMMEAGCIYCNADLDHFGGYCLDRHDNNKGYTNENSYPCCPDCNRAKGTMTHNNFLEWVVRVFTFQSYVHENLLDQPKDIREKEIRKNRNIFFNKSSCKTSDVILLAGKR